MREAIHSDGNRKPNGGSPGRELQVEGGGGTAGVGSGSMWQAAALGHRPLSSESQPETRADQTTNCSAG